MSNPTSHAAAARSPAHPAGDRHKALRWATVTLLLLLAAAAASRA